MGGEENGRFEGEKAKSLGLVRVRVMTSTNDEVLEGSQPGKPQ
jgi:hypothetical protein